MHGDVLDAHEVFATGRDLGRVVDGVAMPGQDYLVFANSQVFDQENLPVTGHDIWLPCPVVGPFSYTLNQAIPEPSHVAAVSPVGTLAR